MSSVTHDSGADPSISQTVRESDEPPPPLEPLPSSPVPQAASAAVIAVTDTAAISVRFT
ncbi:hypothetical protein [Streptomyces xiamenensis]|uniref:hypothetical protein n=1 Tax=Streptomyces xiamenensis TaxID=408015 RepID=UPI001FEAE5CA|nr:hypothetical protein [Streptomyces xiamenensis]